jgi:arylsulfatase A-like enzyme
VDTPISFAQRTIAVTTAWGWLGAVAWGAGDLLRIAVATRIAPGVFAWCGLAALTLIGTGAVGAGVGAGVGAITGGRCGRYGASWAGFVVCGWLSFAVGWLARPTPLAAGGSAWVAAIALLASALFVLGAWAARRRWAAAGPALVAVAAAVIACHAVVTGFQAGILGRRVSAVAPPAATNVLLVTLDTTRADRFGSSPIDTSGFDRVASEGASFDLAMSPIPVTAGAHATLFSGVEPWRHGVLLNGRAIPAIPLLAERLSASGYATAGFPSAYVLDGTLGFSRGFDRYDDDFSLFTGVGHTLVGRLFQAWHRHGDRGLIIERRADDTVDLALAWLDHHERAGQLERPFFAWVHLYDAHGPYSPPPPFDERYYRGVDARNPLNHSLEGLGALPPYLSDSLRGITDRAWVIAQYDGEVAYADEQLRRLLAWLDDSRHAEDTVVVVVADHGEGLGEEGEAFTHGDFLYEHDLHVPLAMRWPGRIAPGSRVRWPVGLADVTPTILSLVGLPAVEAATGADLTPSIVEGRRPHLSVGAVCLDRDANRALREREPGAPPRYRYASVRTPEDRLIYREHDGSTRWWVRGAEVAVESQDEAQQEVRRILTGQARALLSGAAAPSEAELDAELLRQLGYLEP